jgi:hypothetical protein
VLTVRDYYVANLNDNGYHLLILKTTFIHAMQAINAPVKKRLLELLDELIAHDGFGSIRVDIRLLKRGQKEVIIDCGKQYRYVVDFESQQEKQGV